MTDIVLVENDVVIQLWMNKPLLEVINEGNDEANLYEVDHNTVFAGCEYIDGNFIAPTPVVIEAPLRIPKLLLLERLNDADLFTIANDQLKVDDFMYQRWLASQSVDTTDEDVIGLLTAIGADLEVMLAPEEI